MGPFHKIASDKTNEITARLKAVETASVQLAELFGEDPKSMPMGELFSIFSTFVSDYKKAEFFLQKRAETEERNRKRKIAEEARRLTQAAKKKETGDRPSVVVLDGHSLPTSSEKSDEKKKEEQPIVDKVVGALQEGSAGSIRQLIRARRRKAVAGRKDALKNDTYDAETRERAGSGAILSPTALPSSGSPGSPGSPGISPSTPPPAPPPASGKSKRKKKPLWQAHKDPDSGDTYFYNTKTGESVWEKPPSFPY
eukprot:TRINITY_DN7395_c0_g1_i1.p1 TRINITY_DN7395_c0_g1~~TRINITY_DN7395_c0_g1_i1.p1  ORF type:complete len:254 (+),score=34.03 TRINITY_DN7395_c0_g1_i1:78-839(+)